MNKLIIIFFISYILYFIQLHLLFQNTYAVLPILKNGYRNILVNSSSFFAYIPNIPFHSQDKNEITETISQIHSSPDRYIPPPPPLPPLSVSPSITSIPQQSHNTSNIYTNPIPLCLKNQTLLQIDTYLLLHHNPCFSSSNSSSNSLIIYPILRCLTPSSKILSSSTIYSN